MTVRQTMGLFLFADLGTFVDAGIEQMDTFIMPIEDAFLADANGPRYCRHANAEEPSRARFNEVVFAATHNSYRDRGTIINSSIVGLLLGLIFSNDYANRQYYRVGHSSPGGEVLFGGGNPDTEALSEWLQVVVNWSDDNPGHAPITVLLDSKDNLRDNLSPDEGNLGRLNAMLRSVIGAKMYWASGFRGWAQVSDLSDKIIIVLSGDRTTRRAYLVDEGQDPAIAVSGNSRIVTMHHDGGERLWYWTGRLVGTDVQWLHHGRHDTGRNPSILFIDNQYVIEVHRSHTRDRLFASLGRYGPFGTMIWYPEIELFDGRNSSLSMTADGRIQLLFDDRAGNTYVAYGQRNLTQLSFDEPEDTDMPLGFPGFSRGITVRTSNRGGGSERALEYRTARQRIFFPIRYEQLMFSEYQAGDDDFLRNSAEFAGFGSGSQEQVRENREGLVTRLWSYDQGDAEFEPPHLPATDEPFAQWYDRAMRDFSAVIGVVFAIRCDRA